LDDAKRPQDHNVLEETGLSYRITAVNNGKGEQFKPDFLAISPPARRARRNWRREDAPTGGPRVKGVADRRNEIGPGILRVHDGDGLDAGAAHKRLRDMDELSREVLMEEKHSHRGSAT
jgi:hypothetical protein